jgi:hypothetical protein
MNRLLRTITLWFFIASTLMTSVHATQPSQAQQPQQRPGSLYVTLRSEQPELRESERSEGTFTTFESAQSLSGQAGEPALPAVQETLGIPSSAPPVVQVMLAEPQLLPSAIHPLEPVPHHEPVHEPGSSNPNGDWLRAEYLPDPDLYARDAWFPANPVAVSDPVLMRGQAMVTVTFTPVQVNLATGELRWFASADVTLSWERSLLPASASAQEDPHFESTFQQILSNYEQARQWREPRSSTPGLDALEAATSGNPKWMIQLEGTGVFRIPLTDLGRQGIDVSEPNRLAMFYGRSDQQEAIWIDSGNLYLINTRPHGRWSKLVGYRLELLPPGNSGKRMQPVLAAPTQTETAISAPYDLRFEEDRVYWSIPTSAKAGERWYWKRLDFGNPTFEATFSLPFMVPLAPAAQVRTELGTGQSRCRTVTVSVNGHSATQSWSTSAAFTGVVTVPQTSLAGVNNTFRIDHQACGDIRDDNMYLNSFTVRYERALVADGGSLTFNNRAAPTNYRVTVNTNTSIYLPIVLGGQVELSQTTDRVVTPAAVEASPKILAFEVGSEGNARVIMGGVTAQGSFLFGRPAAATEKYLITRYDNTRWVTSISQWLDHGLRHDATGTDYLIITHPDFAAALQPLAQHRQARGLKPRIVTTTQIYDDFGMGVIDPAAIRAFIQHAYLNWPVRPAYVLLVGDATYDPFDIMATGFRNWLPPMMVDGKDPFAGEVPADNGYVSDLDGSKDDLPDIFIGRLPANSAADTQAMVQKIINYEAAPPSGSWSRSVLLATDQAIDPAGNFHQLSDAILNSYIPASARSRVIATRAYLPVRSAENGMAIRDDIVNALNQGQVILNYIGHAAIPTWAAREPIWSIDRGDQDLLQPNSRLPVSLPWTCWEGYFVYPGRHSMSETMLRLPDKGIVAAFAPLGLDVAIGHDFMTARFYTALFHTTNPELRLGPLMHQAKLGLVGTSYTRMIYTYILHGDPAMRINLNLDS